MTWAKRQGRGWGDEDTGQQGADGGLMFSAAGGRSPDQKHSVCPSAVSYPELPAPAGDVFSGSSPGGLRGPPAPRLLRKSHGCSSLPVGLLGLCLFQPRDPGFCRPVATAGGDPSSVLLGRGGSGRGPWVLDPRMRWRHLQGDPVREPGQRRSRGQDTEGQARGDRPNGSECRKG